MATTHLTSIKSQTMPPNSQSVTSQDAEFANLSRILLSSTSSNDAKLNALHQLQAYSLSSEKETEYLATMHSSKASEADKCIPNRFFQSVFVSIASIAYDNRNKCPIMDFGDLISHGYLGLLDAVAHYEPSKSNEAKFTTYAFPYIKHAITEACARFSSTITLSKSQIRRINNLLKVKAKLELRLGREPSVDELYEALPGYSKKYIINHKNGFNITISLDAPVNPNDSTDKTTYQDFYDSTHCNESFVNNLIKDEVYAFLYENLNRLDEMSQKIVFFRFGMNGNPRLKEKEIGKLLEISTQSVSRITRDAIIKLRAMMTMPESAA